MPTRCATHGANKINEAIFNEPEISQKRMDTAVNSIKNTTFGTFLKNQVMRDEIIDEMKENDSNSDVIVTHCTCCFTSCNVI